jgi:hypothetical protein
VLELVFINVPPEDRRAIYFTFYEPCRLFALHRDTSSFALPVTSDVLKQLHNIPRYVVN